ncbi:Metal-sulfur cluster biosynthetic enzyme [Lutibacter oricola]|uniref:Metal-sulfur cluster biosynthetic enzyme n=1 Tax=Lutibacter oricola TaxID=762486 RepID=A0A1H2YYX8_9FLAO|nr:metal-sulfur cluster assembly factor [Lutibacter oricola]SDX09968.1 Metal-sulfur cluster biosynthetic enzyme [Lutibacter oricola]
MTKEEITQFELELLELLKNVMDPEIEINIVDLGLIYELNYDEGKGEVDIDLTFSTPSCPLGETIISNIKETIAQKHPSIYTNVNVVFEPKWSTANISEEGKKILGM